MDSSLPEPHVPHHIHSFPQQNKRERNAACFVDVHPQELLHQNIKGSLVSRHAATTRAQAAHSDGQAAYPIAWKPAAPRSDAHTHGPKCEVTDPRAGLSGPAVSGCSGPRGVGAQRDAADLRRVKCSWTATGRYPTPHLLCYFGTVRHRFHWESAPRETALTKSVNRFHRVEGFADS